MLTSIRSQRLKAVTTFIFKMKAFNPAHVAFAFAVDPTPIKEICSRIDSMDHTM